jgi:hypothetical protein
MQDLSLREYAAWSVESLHGSNTEASIFRINIFEGFLKSLCRAGIEGESEFKPLLDETEERDAVQYGAITWLLKRGKFIIERSTEM